MFYTDMSQTIRLNSQTAEDKVRGERSCAKRSFTRILIFTDFRNFLCTSTGMDSVNLCSSGPRLDTCIDSLLQGL
jgi:hypothetical protein